MCNPTNLRFYVPAVDFGCHQLNIEILPLHQKYRKPWMLFRMGQNVKAKCSEGPITNCCYSAYHNGSKPLFPPFHFTTVKTQSKPALCFRGAKVNFQQMLVPYRSQPVFHPPHSCYIQAGCLHFAIIKPDCFLWMYQTLPDLHQA